MSATALLVGLGNPGPKYAGHRHNVGFMAVDAIADRFGFAPARRKFQGEIREGEIGGVRTLILKPQTYMNESGRSVAEAARFFKISPSAIVVFHDELDLGAGRLKVKTGGGGAGHNGLKSISAHLGPGFRRVRIGIGHPGDKARVTGHVLGDFSKADRDWLEPALNALAEAAPALFDGDAKYSSAIALARGKEAPSPSAREEVSKERESRDGASRNDTTDTAPKAGPLAEALKKLLGNKD